MSGCKGILFKANAFMTVNNENIFLCYESYFHKMGFDTMNCYLLYCYYCCCLYQHDFYYRNFNTDFKYSYILYISKIKILNFR